MAWATCTACGHRTAWAQHRGARLRDVTCTTCGRKGLLEGSSNAGKRLRVCPLCSVSRYAPGGAWRELERTARVWGEYPTRRAAIVVPAGVLVCRLHLVEPVDLQDGMDGQPVVVVPHPHVVRRRQLPGLYEGREYRARLAASKDGGLVAVVLAPFVELPLNECAWRPVPREEVPTA